MQKSSFKILKQSINEVKEIYYKYGKREIEYLKKADPILGRAIEKIGYVKRKVNRDIFSALVSSVISQQISTKAAETVESRLTDLLGDISPENIVKADIAEIHRCGMSMRKAEYIKNIGEMAFNGTINFNNLYELSDEDFIKEITKIRGVGVWTAEMLLIHSLERENILSFKDLGIRRGIEELHGIDELSMEEFEKFKNLYSPFGTIASIYLWEISSKKNL